MLRTKGTAHTDLSGFHTVETTCGDTTITDGFRIVEKTATLDGQDGFAYDWYTIADHYRYTDRTSDLRTISGIAFVSMAEAGQIDGVTAAEHSDMFAQWNYPVEYKQGNIRSYQNQLYKCVQAHTSQEDWTPDKTASLWTPVADPSDPWPEWSQPIGANDAYPMGAQVSHNSKHWTSNTDNNVWEPGVYGWDEVPVD